MLSRDGGVEFRFHEQIWLEKESLGMETDTRRAACRLACGTQLLFRFVMSLSMDLKIFVMSVADCHLLQKLKRYARKLTRKGLDTSESDLRSEVLARMLQCYFVQPHQ